LRFAILRADERDQPVGVGHHEIEGAPQNLGTHAGSRCRPRRERAGRGIHGGCCFRRCAIGYLGDDRAGGRVTHVERRGRSEAAAVDEDAVLGVQIGDGVFGVHHPPYG
jgi:hypothetical protein